MSWHPYDPKRPEWAIYWGERQLSNSTQQNDASTIVEFELTQPYSMYRDTWRDLQMAVLIRLVPAGYTINVSQLWSRLWPQDGPLRFSKFNDMYKLPILISSDLDEQTQPGKRKDFFWVMTQFEANKERLEDIVFFQGLDLENITWITKKPIEPWPTQLFEYNRAAFAWNTRMLKSSDFDLLVQRECWAFSATHLGSLDFMTMRDRLRPEAIMEILQEEASQYNLEVQIKTFAERPPRPNFFKSLKALPGHFMRDGWSGLKARQRPRQ